MHAYTHLQSEFGEDFDAITSAEVGRGSVFGVTGLVGCFVCDSKVLRCSLSLFW